MNVEQRKRAAVLLEELGPANASAKAARRVVLRALIEAVQGTSAGPTADQIRLANARERHYASVLAEIDGLFDVDTVFPSFSEYAA
jgi:hypothetical protein